MNEMLPNLIPAIVSAVNDRGGYVTKTKLLKLLYLFDVEYYRVFRKTFTGFEWKFYHLGPWTSEYDGILDQLLVHGVLEQQVSARSEYDTLFFRSPEPHDFSRTFSSFAEEAPLRQVLSTWADATTGEILDFVYFRTEPMEHGVRNTPLDFSHIPEEKPLRYVRTASGTSSKDKKLMRARLRARLEGVRDKKGFDFTPPKHDEIFEQEMSRLEDKRD